jgi:putative MATE family efflux protein
MSPPEHDAATSTSRPPLEAASPWQLLQQALRGDEQDYTALPLRRAVFLLAVPMVMEMAMESLFAVADIFWVSRLGADAVATVGLTESLIAMVYALALGLSVAATAVVSRRIGEGQVRAASAAAGQVLLLSLLLSAAVSALGAWSAPQLLAWMGASPGVLATGTGYAQVLLGSSATVIMLFALNAVFRGAGDAATAMRSLVLANFANIVLGPIFIFGLGPLPAQGVTGAAVATCLGRGLGVSYQLVQLARRRSRLQVRPSDLRPERQLIGSLLRLAGTGTMQSLLETSSWLGLVRILSTFGSAALAGYTIAMRIAVFALLPSWGMANAAATLVGQNLGASQPERAERAVWVVGLYNFMFLGAVGLVFTLLPEPLARFFTTEPEELGYASSCLRIVALGFLFYAYGMVLVQAFNGAGDTRTPTVLNVLAFWCFKIPLAYFLALQLSLGPQGVFIAITAAYSGLALLAAAVFRRGRWKLQKV